MVISRMPVGGGGKGELHGASILVTVEDGTSGETVTLTLGSTFSKSGVLSDDGTCLFTDLLEAGTYTATYQTFTASVEVSASDILNKVTKSVTIAMSITITLTLEGAKEDTITITDKDGANVGVCVFPTDSVTGTVSFELPESGSGSYTFTSSVAKDTTIETSDYSKMATITESTTNVKVMPEGALYWYGNECVDVTGGWGGSNVTVSGGYVSVIPDVVKNTNQITVGTNASRASIGALSTQVKIDTFGYTKLCMEYSHTHTSSDEFVDFSLSNTLTSTPSYGIRIITSGSITVPSPAIVDISSIIEEVYVYNMLVKTGGSSPKYDVTIPRIWLE